MSDEEVLNFLKKIKITDITKDSAQFAELRNKLILEKINEHYLKIFNEFKGRKEIFVNLPKKQRSKIELDFKKLIPHLQTKNDELKITLIMNPERKEQKNLLQVVESVSSYLSGQGKKISWYFLPFTDEENSDSIYRKLLICSMDLDHGKGYQTVMDVSKNFKDETQVLEFLNSRKFKTDSLASCLKGKEVKLKISNLDEIIQNQKINKSTQIVYGNEVESQIPGLIDLKDRVEMKLRLKTLIKK